jgi:CRP/FNR family transcriptional regulator, nitrogen fixation regulation protein
MLVRSAATVTRPFKSDCLAVTQFGSIENKFGLDLWSANFVKNEQIFGEGAPTDHVYQVITGAVRSFKLLSDGRCQITAFYLPGDIFGIGFSDAHPMTAEAIVDTTVRVAYRRKIENVATTDASVSHELWCLTAAQLKHAESHLLLLGRKTAIERVATFLMEMDDRLGGDGTVPLPMCRRDIGDYLGLTLETVSRVLSALHIERIIDFSGAPRLVVLRNRARLRAIRFSTHLN